MSRESKKQAESTPNAWRLASKTAPLALSGEENAIYSPACIYEGLRTLRLGAEGTTANELDELLGENWDSTACDWMGLGESDDYYTTHLATALWLDDKARPSQEFLNECKSRNLSVETTCLSDPKAGSRITQWVSDHTEGLLAPSIEPDPNSLACMASALYLKDAWRNSFNKSDSRKEPVHTATGDLEVTFMANTFDTSVADTPFGTLVACELDHGSKMVFALPNEEEDLANLMASGDIVGALSKFDGNAELVELHLPKFTCETDLNKITSILKQAGFTTAAAPDLAPMTGTHENLTTFAHSTRIAIDEEGLEAASTFIMVAVAGLPPFEEPPKPRVIRLDRPFAYGIVSPTGQPLFLGTLTRPDGNDLGWESLPIDSANDGSVWLEQDEEIPGICRLTRRMGDLDQWEEDGIDIPIEGIASMPRDLWVHRFDVQIYGHETHVIWTKDDYSTAMESHNRIRSELRNYAARLQNPNFDADAWIKDFTERWK